MFISFVIPSLLNPSNYKISTVYRVSVLSSVTFTCLCCFLFLLLQVAELTDSVQQIAEALQGSPVVEVQVFLVSVCVLYCVWELLLLFFDCSSFFSFWLLGWKNKETLQLATLVDSSRPFEPPVCWCSSKPSRKLGSWWELGRSKWWLKQSAATCGSRKQSCFRWSATVSWWCSREQPQWLGWCKPLNHHVWSWWLVLDMKYVLFRPA